MIQSNAPKNKGDVFFLYPVFLVSKPSREKYMWEPDDEVFIEARWIVDMFRSSGLYGKKGESAICSLRAPSPSKQEPRIWLLWTLKSGCGGVASWTLFEFDLLIVPHPIHARFRLWGHWNQNLSFGLWWRIDENTYLWRYCLVLDSTWNKCRRY